MSEAIPTPDENNIWRLETNNASDSWDSSPYPNAENKYFMVSTDGHLKEPKDVFSARVPEEYWHRLPGIQKDKKGNQTQKTEGISRPLPLAFSQMEGEEAFRNQSGHTPEARIEAMRMDGIDAEVLFPNIGLLAYGTRDAEFSQLMCRAWNDWAWETYGPYNDRLSPMACIAPNSLEGAIAEINRCAKLGFRGFNLPCKPYWGPPDHEDPNYNQPEFDPLWACIQDVDKPITFHVSTGRDPRTSRGAGGAIINYAVHSLAPTMEPIANLCASGVLDRFPKLQFGAVESGIGWVAWALQAMDEAYVKHHMWRRPKLKMLPSEYFKQNGFATFQEDKVGLDTAREYGLVNNFMWANDFPHHEGTWPHSAQAIERTMVDLNEQERAQILGLNAARVFNFEVKRLQDD